MKAPAKINWIIFILGFAGVLSFLLTDIPLDKLPPEAVNELANIPNWAFKLISLINPTILLILFTLTGAWLTPKLGLKAPLITALVHKQPAREVFFKQFNPGMVWGIIGGALIVMCFIAAAPWLPPEYFKVTETFSLSPVTRFLYGGLTEEVLLRWGLMSLLVWGAWKIFARKKEEAPVWTFWTGIFISSVLFGVGHLPIAFFLVGNVTPFFIVFVITVNAIFGMIAGWLFWKKGLEAAMIAHIFVHVVMITYEIAK